MSEGEGVRGGGWEAWEDQLCRTVAEHMARRDAEEALAQARARIAELEAQVVELEAALAWRGVA